MRPPVITFFNNKGGVGKTSLVYHLGWMLANLGYRVVAADLDPQANLTAAFLDEEEVEQLWNSAEPRTIWSAIRPFVDGEGVVGAVTPTPTIDERLALLPGDLSLSRFEDELSSQWRECLDGTRLRPFLVTSAFWTVLRSAAARHWSPPTMLWSRSPLTCSACRDCATSGPRSANGAMAGANGSVNCVTPAGRCRSEA